jgi:hypothetical protein
MSHWVTNLRNLGKIVKPSSFRGLPRTQIRRPDPESVTEAESQAAAGTESETVSEAVTKTETASEADGQPPSFLSNLSDAELMQ